jgi:methylase of polypeptide subunit release factors
MPDQVESAKQMISRCRRLRDEGSSEAVLRTEFASRLRQVFPNQEDQLWIDHYTEGEEAATRVGRSGGGTSQGFIDTLVRSTVIEYEPDLRLDARWDQGYQQVKEYAAGAIRAGMAVSQVRGVLSDTVDWHVYDIQLAEGVTPAECTDEDVTLLEVESFQAETADNGTAQRFLTFLKEHLAREQSRLVAADFIAGDLGLESAAYGRHVDSLVQLVEDGRSSDDSIALATDLWSRFVDYLEHDEGEFRASAYVDEAYVAILARLLCANILQQRARLSNDAELGEILNGQYFETEFQLRNMVEQDYFGWMLRPEHLPRLMPVAREMQRDLYAYDFSAIQEEDLFGRLMAQLARRTQRKLLGQEWTPQWIARALADRAVSLVGDESPCFVDMCCGSGSIMAEVIKASKAARPSACLAELATAVTGFDIDPLAVMLAKTTWIVTLAAEIRTSTLSVTVPVYHADSLFAVTPITERMPLPGEAADIPVDLDGERITLSAVLVTPALRSMFDDIVDWCYDEARKARDDGDADAITRERANQLVAALAEGRDYELSDQDKAKIAASVHELASRMGRLAIADRNGIWAFILRNTYRPGLLAGQFNGLVSNPPWLAMSQFADNPYKEALSSRASSYGIKPGGAAHLHAELATTHLLHAVDRYLKDRASVACLVPGTVLNGMNHQKLRNAAYLEADRPVPLELQEVWGIAPGTFKVRSVALIGVKRASAQRVARSTPRGAVATDSAVQATPLTVRNLGRRSACPHARDQRRRHQTRQGPARREPARDRRGRADREAHSRSRATLRCDLRGVQTAGRRAEHQRRGFRAGHGRRRHRARNPGAAG